MRALIIIAISLFFSLKASAQEVGGPPTEFNWGSFSSEICNPDPEDPLGLRPVIFPAQYTSYKDNALPEHYPRTGLAVVHGQKDENGDNIPPQIVDTAIPWMYNGPSYRLLTQYVGYLNKENIFVDKHGNKVSIDNPLQIEASENNWGFEDYRTEIVISKIPEKENLPMTKGDSEYDFSYKMQNAPNCSFRTEWKNGEFGLFKVKRRVVESPFTCKDNGGFYTPPPITRTLDVRRIIKPSSQHILIKDYSGNVVIGEMSKNREEFNALMKHSSCEWEYLR